MKWDFMQVSSVVGRFGFFMSFHKAAAQDMQMIVSRGFFVGYTVYDSDNVEQYLPMYLYRYGMIICLGFR